VILSFLFWTFFGTVCQQAYATETVAESAAVVASAEKKEHEGPMIADELFKIRDPFKMPELEKIELTPKTDLERFPVEAFKLMGVLTGPEKLRAMVQAPDGKTYFVAEASRIGIKGGIVKKITPTSIKIREKFVNMIGREEDIESEIRMLPEGRNVNKTTGRDSGGSSPGNSLREKALGLLGK
jgi:Tfp pilus assembly protein PilP